MSERDHEVIQPEGGAPIRAWVRGVPFDPEAKKQLSRAARLPFIHKWIAVMPDVHVGKGCTVGSVIPTAGAIVPAAVGVDIGCGMMAVQTTLDARDLPDDLHEVRTAIEAAVPHGRTDNGGRTTAGPGARPAPAVEAAWEALAPAYARSSNPNGSSTGAAPANHLGTLGTGNHFIEVCLDEADRVWFMLHSGSRGVGNRIGTYFIELAKEDMRRWFVNLPDADLAYLPEGTKHFKDYVLAVDWAQDYAMKNRRLMMENVVGALRRRSRAGECRRSTSASRPSTAITTTSSASTTTARTSSSRGKGRCGRGRTISASFRAAWGPAHTSSAGSETPRASTSCSHGAGRAMSRTEAKRRFTVADHAAATAGIECRKDEEVIDETPAAYKSIDAVMEAQKNLVEIVHTLRQVVCVKG